MLCHDRNDHGEVFRALAFVDGRLWVKTGKAQIEHMFSGFAPKVVEELAAIPPERRAGAVIVNEVTGLPYRSGTTSARIRPATSQHFFNGIVATE